MMSDQRVNQENKRVTFEEISDYWENKHPGRMIGGETPEDDYRAFFKKVDDYKYHRNHYQYLKDGVAEFDQHEDPL